MVQSSNREKGKFLFLGDRGNDLKADSATHLVLELFLGVLKDPYLPLVFGRKLMTTKTGVVEENERKLVETERLLANQDQRINAQVEKLKKLPSLAEAAELIAKGHNLKAASKLEAMAADLRSAA